MLYALTPVEIARRPRPGVEPAKTVVSWLAEHDLHDGLAPYWFASYMTVLSHDEVRVRPVLGDHGRLAAFADFSDKAWFRPSPGDRTRFVMVPVPNPAKGVDLAAATASFGPPVQVVDVAGYRIAIWDAPLLAKLSAPVKTRLALSASGRDPA
jgi:hypothetical protein